MNSLIDVATGGQRRSYVNFIYRVYVVIKDFKDTLTPLVRLFLRREATPSPLSASSARYRSSQAARLQPSACSSITPS